MTETNAAQHELPNFVGLLAEKLEGTPFAHFLHLYENIIFSLIIVAIVSLLAFFASRRSSMIPGRLQLFMEIVVGGLDDFVCGILGPKGKKFTPFIGTLFIYILLMNLMGMVPFMKSSTSSLSTTAALAVCVFLYVQFTAIKENGIIGYLDHLAGNPRGVIAFTAFIPVLLFFIHLISELVKPLSLSLRLANNIWAEDMLLAVSSQFGLGGVPLFLFNMFITLLGGMIQAIVFCLLSTVYFALVMPHHEEST
ncbi:MAG TPA: F0F1 ATP synthase subunit A [Candidatus Omnitrophota bacterium]|nr:F0F1 ATP synthase subunit A [Candidatus Omnitrophota bacterium]HPN65925.1 F0F1 ATP synthase subunit A [Candidatus Omnitrophota bacterium]HRZ66540.1 F0F1 ATP synthase subunit A [Candidatus Omnitrophota bacterium]